MTKQEIELNQCNEEDNTKGSNLEEYLDELQIESFYQAVVLEKFPKVDAEDEIGKNKEKYKGDINNTRKQLTKRLKGLDMEKSIKDNTYRKGNSKIYPTYMLLLFRKLLLTDIKNPFISNISKKRFKNMKDEDIAAFLDSLKDDYKQWERQYIKTHKIEKIVRQIEEDEYSSDTIEETLEKIEQEEKERQKNKEREGKACRVKGDEEFKQILDKLVGLSKKEQDEYDIHTQEDVMSLVKEKIEGKTLSGVENSIVYFYGNKNAASMLINEIKQLVEEKRKLAALRAELHKNLDTAINKTFKLVTITNKHFDMLETYKSPLGMTILLPRSYIKEFQRSQTMKKPYICNRVKLKMLEGFGEDIHQLCTEWGKFMEKEARLRDEEDEESYGTRRYSNDAPKAEVETTSKGCSNGKKHD